MSSVRTVRFRVVLANRQQGNGDLGSTLQKAGSAGNLHNPGSRFFLHLQRRAEPAPYESPPEGGKALPPACKGWGSVEPGPSCLGGSGLGGYLVPKHSWHQAELTLEAQEGFQWGDLE